MRPGGGWKVPVEAGKDAGRGMVMKSSRQDRRGVKCTFLAYTPIQPVAQAGSWSGALSGGGRVR